VGSSAIAGLCVCAVACLPPSAANSTAPDTETQTALDRSIRFLQESQNADGGFGASNGAASDPDFSAWAAYALAAAGINPQDQARPGGTDVFDYLAENTADLRETTDFDRVALVALASGTSPYAFGDLNPLDAILARQLPDGGFPQRAGGRVGWANATVWSIFPLSAIGSPAAEAATQRAADWLQAQQGENGSWGSTTASSAPDSDLTGAAIEALNAAGLHDTEAQARGFDFLESQQGADGGFRESDDGPTNSATTAWVVQGMWAAGVDPRQWRTEAGRDPLAFLASLQRPDGSIGWTADDDANSLWMTAQVGPALAGATYPLPAVPRVVKAPSRPGPPQPLPAAARPRASYQRGHGGVGTAPREGVIAGGGGGGAPLFSRPQPQSAGFTPGGPRRVRAHRRGASDGTVEGLLVGSRPSGPAAPGLLAADSGGTPANGIALALAAAMLGAAALGTRRERAGAMA
jgi:hypothetical protein